MARGRMINTSITRDEEFNEMSIDAQFIFMRTIPFLDRDGLITGNIALLWSDVAPLLPSFVGKMDSIIKEWCDFGFCIKYKDGKKDVLFFPSFKKNQSGMRYEKEAPSQFSPPPGYTRTKDGLVKDTEINSKKEENTDGGQGTDKVRTEDVKGTLEEKRIGREEEGESTHARTHENTRNEQLPPPFSLEDKQPEYRDALPGEYLPGLVAPKRKQVLVVTQTMADAQRLGVEPKEFRLMVDAFLTGCASKPLADAGGQSGEQVLLYAQEQVLQICRVGAQFRSPEGIELIFKSWRENDWRGETVPNSKQVLEHASKMVCGQVVNERRKVTKQQEDNKALFVDSRTRTDIPQYLREALNQ